MAMCIDVSRGTAYGLSLSQMALSLGSALFFPSVRVQIYAPVLGAVNDTFVMDGVVEPRLISIFLHTTVLVLAPLLLLSAACVVLFSFITMGLQDKNLLSNMDYSQESLESLGIWNLMFWSIFALSHMIVALVVDSPCDVYAVALGVAFMVKFMMDTCAPLTPGNNTQTQNTLNILSYLAGVYVVCHNIPGGVATGRGGALAMLVFVDAALSFGHTWDRESSMDTITNCRLFYVCVVSLGLCLLYSVWYDSLRVP